MTNTDRLFGALKILGITTEPKQGLLAWYAPSGEYLGTHGIDDGLVYIKDVMNRVGRP